MRKAAASGNHVDMYFPEVDVNIRSHPSRESVPLGYSYIIYISI